MKILGIETSCDETAVAVLEGKGDSVKVLSNVISSQIKLHAKFGGVVPYLAAREHVKNIEHVFNSALKAAGVKDFKKEIDLIAVTRGPGLGPALLVGLTFARTLAWKYDLPLVGVSHLDGHIHSNWLADQMGKDIFPALNLIVSGGHTELVLMKNHGKYKIIGETQDDAVGEAFDKVARLLGLGYPGGPIISKLAEEGNPDKYRLPSPMIKSKDYNFSYSGLKTAVLYLLRDLKIKKPSLKVQEDVSASFQKAAIEVLVQKTIRAAKDFKVKSILLSGGVSANKYLRQQLQNNALENDIKYFQPSMEFTTDNAAMIAAAGYFEYKKSPSKKSSGLNWRTISMDANLSF